MEENKSNGIPETRELLETRELDSGRRISRVERQL